MQSMEEPLKDDKFSGRDRLAKVESKALPMALLMITLVPFLIFTAICFSFLFVYHDMHWLVWGSVTLFGLCPIAMLGLSWMKTGNARTKDRRVSRRIFLQILAASWVFATMTSTILGWYVYNSFSSLFFDLKSRRVYVNVRPEEPAAAHADASWLFFSEDTRLELDLALGYLHEGTTYCVAPVIGDHDVEAIQYWAVGEDCCKARGGFKCDDAEDASVKSGLVVLDNSPSLSKVAVYKSAVEQSEAAFGFKSDSNAVFVRWIADPEAAQDGYQRQAIDIISAACVFYFVLSALNGFLLHYSLGGEVFR